MPGLANYFPFLIPLVVAAYLLWVFWNRSGEPERDSAAVQYDPPENLTPGECGALVENAVDLRCITATIVDLSVKGYLTIDRKGPNNGPNEAPIQGEAGKDTAGDYYFHLTKPLSEWKNLKPHEWQVASAIFIPTNPLRMLQEAVSDVNAAAATNPALAAAFSQVQESIAGSPDLRALAGAGNTPQSSASLSELRNHFPMHLARIRKAVFDALQAGGYYVRRPDQIQLVYRAASIMIGIFIFVAGLLAGLADMDRVPWIMSAVLTTAIIWGVGMFMPAKSSKGTQALGKVLGFRDFLARVEKDRLRKLDDAPELFEKYLPYAMSLGVDRKWAEAFAGIAVAPPQWYRGRSGNFFPVEFVNDLDSKSEDLDKP